MSKNKVEQERKKKKNRPHKYKSSKYLLPFITISRDQRLMQIGDRSACGDDQ